MLRSVICEHFDLITQLAKSNEINIVWEFDKESGKRYAIDVQINEEHAMLNCTDYDTLEEFLTQLAIRIEVLKSIPNFHQRRIFEEKGFSEIYTVLQELYCRYYEFASGVKSFESKTEYYERRLDYALYLARSASYSLVNRDMHYYDDEDRYNPEYTSLNSDLDYLLNAKKRFEQTEEMDSYVLKLADSLSRRYDYSY